GGRGAGLRSAGPWGLVAGVAPRPGGGPMPPTAGKPQLDELLMVIDGSPRAARSGRTYTSTDPYTGQPWAQVPDADAQDVDAAVAAARAALSGPWGKLTATQRGKLLHRLGELIARDAQRLGGLETRDKGKPPPGRGEPMGCPR